MTSRSDLLKAIGNRNVQAFLTVVRAGLSTDHGDGYRTTAGIDLLDDLSWHPGCRVILTPDQRYGISSAAGAYRILHKVWTSLADRYGFEDFHPQSQDEAAVALIALHGALEDIIAGRLAAAIEKCGREWPCLPGAAPSGPELPGVTAMSMERAEAIYHRRGGRLEGEMLPSRPKSRRMRRWSATRPILFGLAALGLLAWALHSRGAFAAMGTT